MANTADKVINIALAEVGYLEKKSNAYLYDKTKNAGYNNYTKYGIEMHEIYPSVMDYPAAWCDAFVDWCFYKAYGVEEAKKLLCGNFDDYTINSAQYYKNKKRWFNYPKYGDQIFFKNSTRICHTGLVYMVDSKKVYTVEGNTSSASGVVPNGGGVFKKSYLLGSASIAGYGRPEYDEVEDPKDEVYEGFLPAVDGVRWWYQFKDKSFASDGWYYLKETTGGTYGWYLFDSNGYMLTGYQTGPDGRKYFLCPEKGTSEGQCMTTDKSGALIISPWEEGKGFIVPV